MPTAGPERNHIIKIFYDDHYTAAEYAFDTTRKAAHIADAIRNGRTDGAHLVEPSTGSIAAAATGIHHLHDPDYVEALRTGRDRNVAESQGFEWCPGIWPMAVHSTAGVIAATDSALEHGVAGSLSSGLHHARPEHGAGFCTVNGLAIAAARLAGNGLRVVVLDLDAHCGGGTAAMIGTHDLAESVRQFDLSTNTSDGYAHVRPDDRLVVVPARRRRLHRCRRPRARRHRLGRHRHGPLQRGRRHPPRVQPAHRRNPRTNGLRTGRR